MAKSKNNAKKVSYISVPSQIINSVSSSSLQNLLLSPKKTSRKNRLLSLTKSPRFWFAAVFFFCLVGMLKLAGFNIDAPYSSPCFSAAATQQQQGLISAGFSKPDALAAVSDSEPSLSLSRAEPESESEPFWKQPDGLGYRPCLIFSKEYGRATEGMVNDRSKYLMVVVSGGMNQQRNQIVDAVVIARILGAALVVPVLQVNVIWGDERYVSLFLFFPFLNFDFFFFSLLLI